MPYDAALEARIDHLSLHWPGFVKKSMFGGKGYLLLGHMAFGIWHDKLIVRCGSGQYADCLEQPGARVFDITGKAMDGWVMVAPEGFATATTLLVWLERGRDFAAGLPPK